MCDTSPTLMSAMFVLVSLTRMQSVIFGRPFVKRFALCYHTVVCLSVTLVYCGQTAGWIKMPLGTEIGLAPGHIALDGDPAPPEEKGHSPPSRFRPMSVVAKRLAISATAELLFIIHMMSRLTIRSWVGRGNALPSF